jgi:hypothetical protein
MRFDSNPMPYPLSRLNTSTELQEVPGRGPYGYEPGGGPYGGAPGGGSYGYEPGGGPYGCEPGPDP